MFALEQNIDFLQTLFSGESSQKMTLQDVVFTIKNPGSPELDDKVSITPLFLLSFCEEGFHKMTKLKN